MPHYEFRRLAIYLTVLLLSTVTDQEMISGRNALARMRKTSCPMTCRSINPECILTEHALTVTVLEILDFSMWVLENGLTLLPIAGNSPYHARHAYRPARIISCPVVCMITGEILFTPALSFRWLSKCLFILSLRQSFHIFLKWILSLCSPRRLLEMEV